MRDQIRWQVSKWFSRNRVDTQGHHDLDRKKKREREKAEGKGHATLCITTRGFSYLPTLGELNKLQGGERGVEDGEGRGREGQILLQ